MWTPVLVRNSSLSTMLQIVSTFLILLTHQLSATAQDCDTTVYEVAEEMPEYPGGLAEMYT